MVTARLFLGVSLFALLFVHICSTPVQKVSDPGTSHGGSHTHSPVNYASPQGVPPSYFSPGSVYSPPSNVVSMPVAESSSFSGPVEGGYNVQSVPAVESSQSGPALSWLVDPVFGPDRPSAAQASSAGAADETSQFAPLLPPEPEYRPGELSTFEKSAEAGDYQSETEDLSYPHDLSMKGPAGPGFISQPLPPFGLGGYWGYPYPHFDYRFLTGQYPLGTVSRFSHNYEQGHDYWQDAHYVKEHSPYNPGVDQQTQTPGKAWQQSQS